MKCTICGGETGVEDSRPRKTNSIRRKRICLDCKAKFVSWEVAVPHDPAILLNEIYKRNEKINKQCKNDLGKSFMSLIGEDK